MGVFLVGRGGNEGRGAALALPLPPLVRAEYSLLADYDIRVTAVHSLERCRVSGESKAAWLCHHKLVIIMGKGEVWIKVFKGLNLA